MKLCSLNLCFSRVTCIYMYNQALNYWCRVQSFLGSDWLKTVKPQLKHTDFFLSLKLPIRWWVLSLTKKGFLRCDHGLREPSAFPRSWMALFSSSSFFLSLGLTALFNIALTTVTTGTECPLAQDCGKEPKNFLTNHSPGRDSCLSHNRTLKRKKKKSRGRDGKLHSDHRGYDGLNCVSPKFMLKPQPPVTVYEDCTFRKVIKVKWGHQILIWYDWCPYRRGSESDLCFHTHTQERPCEDTERWGYLPARKRGLARH